MADLALTFFESNRTVLLFVYGQTFFVLGLAIALQSWKHSRIGLSHALPWLSGFGFTHGLHEWGQFFIPIQSEHLPHSAVDFLVTIQALLLVISFTLLLQFGIELLRPLPHKMRNIRYLPLLLFLAWLWFSFGYANHVAHTTSEWYVLTSNAARYELGFIGALTASYGLFNQRKNLIRINNLPKSIQKSFDIAGWALSGYAILGGLVGLPGKTFPANKINNETVYALTKIPVEVWRSFLGLLLAIAIIRALELFHIEIDRRMESMEEKQVILAERERIGRDLHDGTLQMIYATGLLLRSAEEKIKHTHRKTGLSQVQESIELLNHSIENIREYINNLQPLFTPQSLQTGLRDLIENSPVKSLVEIETKFNLPEIDNNLFTPQQVGHLLAITNEALSNAARHAQARHILITATATDQCLCIEIADDGIGLPSDYVTGYGFRTMQERARIIGSKLSISSSPQKGTSIKIEMPWSEIAP